MFVSISLMYLSSEVVREQSEEGNRARSLGLQILQFPSAISFRNFLPHDPPIT